jgi:hypothetical protein
MKRSPLEFHLLAGSVKAAFVFNFADLFGNVEGWFARNDGKEKEKDVLNAGDGA